MWAFAGMDIVMGRPPWTGHHMEALQELISLLFAL